MEFFTGIFSGDLAEDLITPRMLSLEVSKIVHRLVDDDPEIGGFVVAGYVGGEVDGDGVVGGVFGVVDGEGSWAEALADGEVRLGLWWC